MWVVSLIESFAVDMSSVWLGHLLQSLWWRKILFVEKWHNPSENWRNLLQPIHVKAVCIAAFPSVHHAYLKKKQKKKHVRKFKMLQKKFWRLTEVGKLLEKQNATKLIYGINRDIPEAFELNTRVVFLSCFHLFAVEKLRVHSCTATIIYIYKATIESS